MRRALSAALSSVVLAGAGVAVTATPAAAAYTTTISPLTVTAGHVSGTVTTDAPYVVVSVREPGTTTPVDSITVTPHAGGELTFDLETWGIASGDVTVKGCDPAGASCESVTAQTFTAISVAPVVTWPTDSTIARGQAYEVTVSDAEGGGLLKAEWSKSERSVRTELAREGTTTLPLERDGAGTVSIWRCATKVPTRCRPTGVSTDLVVDRIFGLEASYLSTNHPINPDTKGPIVITWRVVTGAEDGSQPEREGPLTLDWSVVNASDNSVVPGVGGTLDGLMPGIGYQMRVMHDLSALPDGTYKIRGVLTKDTTDFGLMVSTPKIVAGIVIDHTPPETTSITRSGPSVYPSVDRYHDTVEAYVRYGAEKPASMRVDVVNSSGEVVRSLAPSASLYYGARRFKWNGRTAAGAAVPAGTYVLRSVATDAAGNVSAPKSTYVSVVRKKLSARDFRKTVTASGSEVDRHLGKCATIKSPSSRGWYGSLGLYSNTKCSSDWDASLATTTHAIKVPAATRYSNDLQVVTYGGAATSTPGSKLGIGYVNRDRKLKEQRFLSATVGNHPGAVVAGSDYIFDDRYFVWAAWTGNGHRYDIKNFTVKMTYFVLVSDS